MQLPAYVKTGGYAVLHLIQLITAMVLTIGISTQAQYGPPKICLLYISNYHLQNREFIFDAKSGACGGIVGIGTLGIILSIAFLFISIAYNLRAKLRASRIILTLAVVASIFTFVALIGASMTSVGLKQTCSQFESVSNTSCEAVFATGFFYDGKVGETYRRNLATVAAAAGAGWVMVLSWAVYAALEWYNYKHESERWW
ncbi:hypothetical protein HK097_000560 [Rhizophlyctis rosea]|uniref:MARVEL domain-containing protein n=1 Tax=Rhizophlyctis rosea TaxID=64517 RepID=A0AAD5SK01_9FUNG|nr:hypothetical protein HK097_000560 [Rhizophlyctis rosea]